MEQLALGATNNAEAAAHRISSSNYLRVVGLDLSLTATGYSVWSAIKGKILPPSNGVITNRLRGMERIDHIMQAIAFEVGGSLISGLHVFIENFAYGAQGNAVYEIGMLHGVIRHWLWNNKIKYRVVSPSTLKKFVTGDGGAKKEVVMLDVYKRFGFEARDNNLADAYALMVFGMAVEGLWPKELLSFQKEVVEKFRKNQSMESEDY